MIRTTKHCDYCNREVYWINAFKCLYCLKFENHKVEWVCLESLKKDLHRFIEGYFDCDCINPESKFHTELDRYFEKLCKSPEHLVSGT